MSFQNPGVHAAEELKRPGCGTTSAEGARPRPLSALLFGLPSVGQLSPLKVAQDTRGDGRGLRLVTKGGDLFGCKMAHKAS